jgi:sortase A
VRVRDVKPKLVATTKEVPLRNIARQFRTSTAEGEPVGRLRVPRMGLSTVVVMGTDHDSLKKGPGVDERTHLPGEGQLVYIAGHRTTYLAPFSHIDRLQRGDIVKLSTPYASFEYSVTGHVIVPATDVGRLKSRGHEELALQACHPRFFATERYIVYARLLNVHRVDG